MIRTAARRVVALGSVVAIAGAIVALSSASAIGQTDEGDEGGADEAVVAVTTSTQIFEHTGDAETITIPHGVSAIQVKVSGAQGGDGSGCTFPPPTTISCGEPGEGGDGATVTGIVPVTAGETLEIVVGGEGEDATPTTNGAGVVSSLGEGGDGGFGAGEGGDGADASAPGNPIDIAPGAGGGGGGASAISRDTTPLVVAAGGGGGAGSGVAETLGTQPGGGDGGESGEDGDKGDLVDATFDCAGEGGEAADGGEGGEGGDGGAVETCDVDLPIEAAPGEDGDDGADAADEGDGGDGGLGGFLATSDQPAAGAGGGGGGYAGGGGGGGGSVQGGVLGPGGGGGGGSCLVPEGGTLEDGVRSDDGVIEITYIYAVVAEPKFTG